MITEEQLAKNESEANTVWQGLLDAMEMNEKGFQQECLSVCTMLMTMGFYRTSLVLPAAMAKLMVDLWRREIEKDKEREKEG